MDLDFQLDDYSENNFSNVRLQETKNSWAIPSDGSMESNEEYFWSNHLKLPLGNSKQYDVTTSEENDTIKYINVELNQRNDNRKRKYSNNGTENAKKLQIVNAVKETNSLSTSHNLMQKQSTDKRDKVQNGIRITTWPEDDLSDNLTAEINGPFNHLSNELGNENYNVSDALLSLPSLTVFKQEAPSPTSHENSPLQVINNNCPTQIITQNVNTNDYSDSNNNQNSISTTLQNLLGNGYTGIQSQVENGGAVDSSSSDDGNRYVVSSSDLSEDSRFQYVLAAATSIATKVNEDTLTYLNQGQSYEIKLKKLGDLSNYRGRILKSIIRICFYERRLQYMEREQMSLWQSSRPGDRIIDVDVPLSYGLREVTQPPSQLNAVHFQWDPTKEVGVYIKVNCISTEFTPKKHGGEKGVPFRIQVETYLSGESAPTKRLHAAACQIKVFKLKGADRKHKQDRGKIMKRPPSEQDKYQPSYDCTVLNDIPNESVVPGPLLAVNGVTSTIPRPYSPEGVPQSNHNDYVKKIEDDQNVTISTSQSPLRHTSTSNLLEPENKVQDVSNVQSITLNSEFTVQQTSQWLSFNRFETYLQTFVGFSGADMLRLSKEDLIQICGQADGIRLYNSIHSKMISPKVSMYVCRENTSVYHAIYLKTYSNMELSEKLSTLIGISREQFGQVYFQGPHGIHVVMNDDVVKHIHEESMFSFEILNDSHGYVIILKPIVK